MTSGPAPSIPPRPRRARWIPRPTRDPLVSPSRRIGRRAERTRETPRTSLPRARAAEPTEGRSPTSPLTISTRGVSRRSPAKPRATRAPTGTRSRTPPWRRSCAACRRPDRDEEGPLASPRVSPPPPRARKRPMRSQSRRQSADETAEETREARDARSRVRTIDRETSRKDVFLGRRDPRRRARAPPFPTRRFPPRRRKTRVSPRRNVPRAARPPPPTTRKTRKTRKALNSGPARRVRTTPRFPAGSFGRRRARFSRGARDRSARARSRAPPLRPDRAPRTTTAFPPSASGAPPPTTSSPPRAPVAARPSRSRRAASAASPAWTRPERLATRRARWRGSRGLGGAARSSRGSAGAWRTRGSCWRPRWPACWRASCCGR